MKRISLLNPVGVDLFSPSTKGCSWDIGDRSNETIHFEMVVSDRMLIHDNKSMTPVSSHDLSNFS